MKAGQTKLSKGTFTGKVDRKRSVGGFVLTESLHPTGELVSYHSHEHPYLSMVLEGSYEETSGRENQVLDKGQTVFRSSDYEHQNKIGGIECKCFNLEIAENFFSKYELPTPFALKAFERENIEILGILLAFRQSMQDDLIAIVVQENLNNLFVMEEKRNSLHDSYWVSKLARRIATNPQETYAIDNLAQIYGLHPAYMVRKFKDRLGMTIGSYLIRERLKKAIQIMNSKKHSLTEIAHQAGFYDQSHFIRHFNNAFHYTPKYLREAIG